MREGIYRGGAGCHVVLSSQYWWIKDQWVRRLVVRGGGGGGGGYIGVELGAMWCYQASTGESRPVRAEACCEGGGGAGCHVVLSSQYW